MRLYHHRRHDPRVHPDGDIWNIDVHTLKIKCHDSHLFLNYTGDHHYSIDDADRWSQAQSRQAGIQYSFGSRYGHVCIACNHTGRDDDCHDIKYLKACFTFM